MKYEYHKMTRPMLATMAGTECACVMSIKGKGAYLVLDPKQKRSSRLPNHKQIWPGYLHKELAKSSKFDVLVFGAGNKLPQGVKNCMPDDGIEDEGYGVR